MDGGFLHILFRWLILANAEDLSQGLGLFASV